MKRVTPQQQVWKHLRTDDQRSFFAKQLRHLKPRTQEDLCYGILAYIRWGVTRPYDDRFVNTIYQSLVIYIMAERHLGKL